MTCNCGDGRLRFKNNSPPELLLLLELGTSGIVPRSITSNDGCGVS